MSDVPTTTALFQYNVQQLSLLRAQNEAFRALVDRQQFEVMSRLHRLTKSGKLSVDEGATLLKISANGTPLAELKPGWCGADAAAEAAKATGPRSKAMRIRARSPDGTSQQQQAVATTTTTTTKKSTRMNGHQLPRGAHKAGAIVSATATVLDICDKLDRGEKVRLVPVALAAAENYVKGVGQFCIISASSLKEANYVGALTAVFGSLIDDMRKPNQNSGQFAITVVKNVAWNVGQATLLFLFPLSPYVMLGVDCVMQIYDAVCQWRRDPKAAMVRVVRTIATPVGAAVGFGAGAKLGAAIGGAPGAAILGVAGAFLGAGVASKLGSSLGEFLVWLFDLQSPIGEAMKFFEITNATTQAEMKIVFFNKLTSLNPEDHPPSERAYYREASRNAFAMWSLLLQEGIAPH